jgi:hypothetical protein
MKKSQLLDTVCALALFTMIGSANAAIIAGDDTAITGTDRSSAQTGATSPAPLPDVALALTVPGESGQTLHDEKSSDYINRISAESPHADSHINLWLLLIAAAVFGIFSEIFHRRSFNQ